MKRIALAITVMMVMMCFCSCGGGNDSSKAEKNKYRLVKVTVTGECSDSKINEYNEYDYSRVNHLKWCNSNSEYPKIESSSRNNAANPCVWTLSYDKAGNLISKIWKNDDGEEGGYRYTYDDHGNELTATRFCNGEDLRKETSEYNSKNVKIKTEVEYYRSGVKGRTTYDEHGNVILKEAAADGKKFETGVTHKYTYDDSGNILTDVCTKDIYQNGGPSELKYSYTYDKNNKKLSETDPIYGKKTWTRKENGDPLKMEHDRGGDLIDYEVWKYDKKGNLVEHSVEEKSKGKLMSSDRDEHIYKKGNEITVTYYHSERKIFEDVMDEKVFEDAKKKYYSNGKVKKETKNYYMRIPDHTITHISNYDKDGNITRFSVVTDYEPRDEAFNIYFEYEKL